MYEVSEIQDYLQEWLEAERDLVINWIGLQSYPYNYEPIDNVEEIKKEIEAGPIALPVKKEDWELT